MTTEQSAAFTESMRWAEEAAAEKDRETRARLKGNAAFAAATAANLARETAAAVAVTVYLQEGGEQFDYTYRGSP